MKGLKGILSVRGQIGAPPYDVGLNIKELNPLVGNRGAAATTYNQQFGGGPDSYNLMMQKVIPVGGETGLLNQPTKPTQQKPNPALNRLKLRKGGKTTREVTSPYKTGGFRVEGDKASGAPGGGPLTEEEIKKLQTKVTGTRRWNSQQVANALGLEEDPSSLEFIDPRDLGPLIKPKKLTPEMKMRLQLRKGEPLTNTGFVPNFFMKDDHQMSGRAGYLSTKSMTINNGGELQRINNRESIVPLGKQAAIIPPHGPWKSVRENQIRGRAAEGYVPNFDHVPNFQNLEKVLTQDLSKALGVAVQGLTGGGGGGAAAATGNPIPDAASWGAAAGAAMAEQAGPVIAAQLEGVTMQTEGTQTIEMKGGFNIGGSAIPTEAIESLQQNMLAALGGASEQVMMAMGASPEALQKGNPQLGGGGRPS